MAMFHIDRCFNRAAKWASADPLTSGSLAFGVLRVQGLAAYGFGAVRLGMLDFGAQGLGFRVSRCLGLGIQGLSFDAGT